MNAWNRPIKFAKFPMTIWLLDGQSIWLTFIPANRIFCSYISSIEFRTSIQAEVRIVHHMIVFKLTFENSSVFENKLSLKRQLQCCNHMITFPNEFLLYVKRFVIIWFSSDTSRLQFHCFFCTKSIDTIAAIKWVSHSIIKTDWDHPKSEKWLKRFKSLQLKKKSAKNQAPVLVCIGWFAFWRRL